MKTKPAPSAADRAPRRATAFRQQPLRRTCLALLIAACFDPALANPTLPQVVSGQASFAQQGNVFSVTNTPNAIINWQSFSVNPGELTRFIQQSAASTVLNRVTGQDPSRILGALQSNGKVFLINPNGVLFGRDARVDVNGLVASSLGISNADFLAGNYRFDAGAEAGAVSNQGSIATPAGGQVILLAPNVENSGIITAPNGQVMLAAGHSVQLADAANPSLQVTLAAPADQAINLGQVIAQGGRIGMYGALVNQRGRLNADSAVLGENGKIVLKASGTTLLEAGSRTSATGAGKGGEIALLGRRVGLTGDAGVDASGVLGGGSILVGGDYRGANAAVMNAEQSYLGADATLRADATGRGDGGKVIVWSDNATRVFGHISARGGAQGGDGGFVETSGHYLDMQASVDTTAPLGKTGQLLLDPSNIYIAVDGPTAVGAGMMPTGAGNAGNSGGVFSETTSAADSLVTTAALQGALAGANVTVTTNNPNASGAGFIKVVSPVAWGSPSRLTLDAVAGIALNAGINGGPGGGLTLLSANGDITQSASLSMGAGGLTARALAGNVFLSNAGNTILGPVTLQAAQQVALTAAALNIAGSNSGTDTSINTTGGALTINGSVGSAAGVVSLNAGIGGNLNIAGTGAVQGGGSNVVLTGDNIGLNGPVNSNGGNVLLVAGDFGRPGAINVGVAGAINSAGGSVVLNADNIGLLGAINAGVGAVTLEPTDPSQSIHVGVGATDAAGTLGLSEAELRLISTSGQLRVGASGGEGGTDLTVVGNLDLSATLKAGTGNGDLLLAVNQGNLTVNAGAQVVSPGKLNLATSTYDGYTITNNGTLKATEVHLASGKMALEGGLVDAPVVSMSSRNPIDLGSATELQPTTLELSAAELATLNANDLRIEVLPGSTDGIAISAPLTLPGSLTLAAPGTINATAALSVGGTFLLDQGNWVQNTASLPAFSANDFRINRGSATFLRVQEGDGGTIPYKIADVYGLQGIASLPMGNNYLLAADIGAAGTVNWNGGEGFAPIGDGDSSNFTGVFDGAGHAISGLTINQPGRFNVGMFAALAGGTVQNFTLLGGSVSGGGSVGAAVGDLQSGSVQRVFSSAAVNGDSAVGGLVGSNSGSISGSQSFGSVVGSGSDTGGLVGVNNSGGSIGASASSASVSGERNVGGLVGRNAGSIHDVFALGSVTGTSAVDITHQNLGGLVGENATGASISQLYSSGAVGGAGFTNVGGVAGYNDGTLPFAYWNGEASGNNTGIGSSGANGGGSNAFLLNNAQSMQQAMFIGFDFTSATPVWRIYEGRTGPLLKALLSPLTANVSGAAPDKVYDGVQTHFAGSIAYTGLSGGDTAPNGTLDYTAALNVGTYALDGLWSTKYDISYSGASNLNITPRALTVSISGGKVYDGTLGLPGAVFTVNNVVGGESVSASGSANFADKNAGTNKPVSGEVALSGTGLGNYSFSGSASGLADITPASVSIAGMSGSNKTYDGGTAATVSAGLSGVLSSDIGNVNLALGASNFSDKKVGTGKTINMVGASLTGTEAGNYVLVSANANTSADITARTLNVNYTGVNKVYDGGTGASFTSTDDRVGGDILTIGASASFTDKNVGPSKAIAISGASLSGTDALNYVLAATSGSATAAITARLLNLTYTGVNKIYDGGVGAGVNLIGDDRVAGDFLTVSGFSGSFANKNVGTGKSITVGGATLSGNDAGNYTVAVGAATADITPATLSIVNLSAASKTYDGGTAATVSAGLSGVIGSDAVTLALGAGNFTNKNAGTGKTVNMAGATLGDIDAGNYTLASTSGSTTADITPRALTVTYSGVNKIYDGSTVAGFTFGDNRVTGDDLGVTASASFSDKNVGGGKPVSISGASLTGLDAGNYTLASTGGSTGASITPRTLTVTYNGVNKVYDGGTAAGFTFGDDRVAGDILGLAASASFGDKSAGTGKLVGVSGASLTGGDAGNYTLASTGGSTTADITPRTLNVTYSGVNKIYDGSTAAGFTFGDDRVTGDILGVTASASFNDKNVGGSKPVSISGASLTGLDAGNYTLASTGGTTGASITPRTLTVTYNGVNKVYDGGTAAGFTFGDDRVAGDILGLAASASFGDKSAGTGKLVGVSGASLTGGDAGNYTLASTSGSTTADITPRTLNVTYSGVNKVYDGSTVAGLTFSDDRVAGDILGVGASASFADKNVGTGKAVSVDSASLTGADAGNYLLAANSGAISADITPRTLTVTYNGQNKVYDGATLASFTTVDDRVSGDVLSVAVSGSFADKNVGTGKAISVSGASLSGADAGNYVLAANSGGASADITARNLNLNYVAGNKVYDGGVAASVSSTDDRVAGDQLSVSQSASFADKNAGANKTVTLSSVLLGGADAGNYVAIYSPALLASISQANLFLSGATVANRVYDGTLLASVTGATLSGVLGQDQVFASGGQGSFADKNVGTGKLVKATGFVLSGADAANYALGSASVGSTADITARTLNLSYSAAGKVYDGGTLASVSGSDDRVAGDVLSISQSASFSDKNVGSGKLVTVSNVALGGADAGNYVLAAGGGQATADITPATLTLSGVSAASRAYDGTANASVSASLGGVIGGDAVLLGGGVGSFSDKNVGSGKSVAVSGFSLGGADAGNYQLSFNGATTTADITQKLLSTWVGTSGGLWSDALNWDGGVVPDGANVLAVNLSGSGVVNYSAAAGSTTIGTLSGSQGLSVSGGTLTLGNAAGDQSLLTGSPGLSVSGGSLQLRGGLTVDDFAQSGGVVGGSGNLSVRRSFSQSAGSLGIEGVLAVVQAAGDLSFAKLSAASVTLAAEAGRISQSGPLVAASLDARAQNGISLTDSGNRIGGFSASNSGSGGIALSNTSNPGTLLLGTLSSGSGDIVVDNTGGIETHAISTSGKVSVTAHSPIQVEGAISGSDIALSASTGIVLASASSLTAQQDVSMTAGTGISLLGSASVSAGGNISLTTATGDISAESGVTINGAGTVSLSAPLGTVLAASSVFTGSAPNVVSGTSPITAPASPVTLALNSTVNIINTVTTSLLPITQIAPVDIKPTEQKAPGVLDKADDKGSSSATLKLETKNEPTKKMYCN